jgi:bifunctional non-homologous end joining protein LigD
VAGTTPLLPELAALPVDAVLDGELVALGEDEWPDFPSVSERLLNSSTSIPLIYIVFDALELDGRPADGAPALPQRRALLESLRLHGPHWQTSALFDDGAALFAAAPP